GGTGPPPGARAQKAHGQLREVDFISGFPKRVRLLRSKDFRRVYDHGSRFSGPLFAAFCVREPQPDGPHIGFTVPRALGKAVARNRIKRRVREVVRGRLDRLNPHWSIVINPRRKALEAPLSEIEREVERLFGRCNGS
ncbi:MAG TPA: ribonuclease P protein component, partial [Bryobacteraceae bacterium]|nr:ribonuclease P protein component [Bryobacteraceae bacterium]